MEMFSSSDQIHQGFSAVRFLDSEHIIAGHYDGYISIFNLNEGEGSCEQKQIHHAALINIDINIDRGHLYTSDQLEILMTDLNKNKVIRNFHSHAECIFSLRINPLGNLLVSGGADKTILVWDVRTAKPINAILAHSSEIVALDWSYDSSTIVSGSTDGYCRLWDIYDGKCRTTLLLENSPPLSSARLSDNSQYILLSALENNLSLWSIKTGKNVIDYKGHVNENILLPCFFTQSCSMTTEEKFVVALGEDNKINVWDVAESQIKHTYELGLAPNEKVKTWDLSEENKAVVLYGKNSLKAMDLKFA